MIESVLEGGWKSILTALVLITMSILSLSSFATEWLILRSNLKNYPASGPQEKNAHKVGIWLEVHNIYEVLQVSGFKGEDLIQKMQDRCRGLANSRNGLTSILASIGANAPYIGLLGTVVGIYGALQAIGLGTDISADRVAGSVGEALVMTALGLVVAIPAVFGFNYILGKKKELQDKIDGYCVLVVTGFEKSPDSGFLVKSKKKRIFR